MQTHLDRNLHGVQERISRACERAGRNPAEVQLVAVTKSVGPEVAAALFGSGQRELAENRIDSLERKVAHFRGLGLEPRWHYVGHIQRNKARRVLRLAQVLHSIDSGPLLDAVARICQEEGLQRSIYLQVKLTDEESKHGIDPGELGEVLERARRMPGLELLGLMAMAPHPDSCDGRDPGQVAAETFRRLRELGEALPAEAFAGGLCRLSMGMSADLELAVAEGSHALRVGRALFDGLAEARGTA